MTTPYTPNEATATATIPIPDDLDDIDSAHDSPAWQRLADMIAKRTPKLYSLIVHTPGSTLLSTSSTSYVEAGGYVDVPACVVGDKLEITFTSTLKIAVVATGEFFLIMRAIDDVSGTPVSNDIDGAYMNMILPITASAPNTAAPMSMSSVWTVVNAGTTRIKFAGKVVSGSDTLQVTDAGTIMVRRVRS